MGNDVVPFLFEGKHLFRSVLVADQPWFIGSDLAENLGHRDASNALRGLDDDEKGTHILSTPGGQQEITIVSEPGLYRAILQRRQSAKLSPEMRDRTLRFQRWVFHDVLPSIRKTGRFNPSAASTPTAGDRTHPVLPRPFDEWTPSEMNARVGAVSEYRMSIGPQAGHWAMLRLGFAMPPHHLLQGRQYEFDL